MKKGWNQSIGGRVGLVSALGLGLCGDVRLVSALQLGYRWWCTIGKCFAAMVLVMV